jgi:hypothetical protein
MASPRIPPFVIFIVPIVLVFLVPFIVTLRNEGVDNHCRPDLSAPAAYPDDAKTADDFLKRGGEAHEPSVCGHRAVAIYSLPGHGDGT